MRKFLTLILLMLLLPGLSPAAIQYQAISQNGVGLALYPITSAEIAANVTPTSYWVASYPAAGVVLAARYGATTSDATGATNAAAIQAALKVANYIPGGAKVVLGGGNFKINAVLTGYSNTYLIGQGMGMGNNTVTAGTEITQLAGAADVIDFPNASSCGLRDIALVAGAGGGGVVWSATGTNSAYYFELDDVAVDLSANSAGVGIWMNVAASGADLYFPRFRNVVVTGGSGNTWGTKVGIRFGNSTTGYPPLVYGDFSSLLVTNVNIGLDLQSVQNSVWKGITLYNISGSGASGIAVKGTKAGSNQLFGIAAEPGTIDTYFNWASGSADNDVFLMTGLGLTPAQVVDSGVNNQFYGDDGSGGFANKFGPALKLYSVRSITVGDNATPAGTPMTLYAAGTMTVNPGAIPANSTVDVVSPAGYSQVLLTDKVFVCPQGGPPAGIVVTSFSTSGGFYVRLANITTAPITPASQTYSFAIFR